ncbi:MAG: hypothetical protein KGQ60_11875, partial [Planctomycetes bacterium]|nr:hypothetical protein [Planctomycetota bacterium]
KRIRSARSILMTGAITSVESARAAVAFARSQNAFLDFSPNGSVIDTIGALSSSGGYTTTLAEAREIAGSFLVVGNDELTRAFPRLMHSLSLSETATDARTVILLGEFSDHSLGVWTAKFPNTWFVPCDLEKIPQALSQWSILVSSPNSSEAKSIFDSLRCDYLTVVWSPGNLHSIPRDFWIEQLNQWILRNNETRRVVGLPLVSQDAVFAQACTWLTAFPGRIQFEANQARYLPTDDYRLWLDRYQEDEQSLVITIHESWSDPDPRLVRGLESFRGTWIPMDSSERYQNRFHLPISIPGSHRTATMIRADQVVMARLDAFHKPDRGFRTPREWLEALSG